MNEIATLLNLPLDTLAVLGTGYVCYKLAYTGQSSHLTGIDVTFISLAFGLVVKLMIIFIEQCINTHEMAVIVASIVTICMSLVWRKWGVQAVQAVLRLTNVSYSDGKSSAWDTLRISTSDRPTQLIVRTNSGQALMCDYLKSFEDLPHGPCLYGQDGSVSLYATHVRMPSENEWIKATWTKTELGAQMTYIPKDNVASIEVRYLTT